MNWIQKTFLWIGIAAIVIMGIFPPWTFKVESVRIGVVKSYAGRSWLWNPPYYDLPRETSSQNAALSRYRADLDLSQLGVQWALAAVVTGGLLVTFQDKRKN